MTGERVQRSLDEIVNSPIEEYSYALLVAYVHRCHGEFPHSAFRYLWFHENAAAAKTLIGDNVVEEIDAALLAETELMST